MHFGHCPIGSIAGSELCLFVEVLGGIEVLLIFIAGWGLDLQQIFESRPDRDTRIVADSWLLCIWRDRRSISLRQSLIKFERGDHPMLFCIHHLFRFWGLDSLFRWFTAALLIETKGLFLCSWKIVAWNCHLEGGCSINMETHLLDGLLDWVLHIRRRVLQKEGVASFVSSLWIFFMEGRYKIISHPPTLITKVLWQNIVRFYFVFYFSIATAGDFSRWPLLNHPQEENLSYLGYLFISTLEIDFKLVLVGLDNYRPRIKNIFEWWLGQGQRSKSKSFGGSSARRASVRFSGSKWLVPCCFFYQVLGHRFIILSGMAKEGSKRSKRAQNC